MPRVITGRFRGTVLFAPEGDKTRPTTDKVKEALFSIIQNEVPGSEFLDLFAGSGQIGIEAVSRGAVRATLVDKGGDPARIISRNLEKIRMKDSPEIRFIKAGFTQARDVRPVHVEAGLLLAIVDGETAKFGAPVIEGASVSANVVKNGKGAKVRVYKMKPKKGYRRTQGHRQPYTKVTIEAINA